MVTIFFEAQWNNWPFFSKCALLLHWWPAIVRTLKAAAPGTFWHVPCDWSQKGNLRPVPNDDSKLFKRERQIAQREIVRERRRLLAAPEQQSLRFEDETK
jgi:hypothetical protein